MVVELKNAELRAKAEEWMAKTGRPFEELVEELMDGYFKEQAEAGEMLDSRYDDIVSGKVKMIDGEEAFRQLMAKTEARRKHRA